MKSFRDRNPYAVGIVSMLVLGVLVGIAFGVGLLHLLEDAYKMRGEFSDASGMRVGDDVKLAGVKVGRVTGIEADREHGRVIVEWVVNSGIDLGPDTRAEIALETLLGSKYLRLSGPVVKPFMADLPTERRTIPIERTSTPFDVFELTRVATNSIEATHKEQLNEFINQLAEVTEGKAGSVRQLVEGIDRVAGAINERDEELRSLLRRADDVSATLADKDQELVQLIDASQGILALISQRRDDLATALGEGSNAVEALSRVLREHSDELDRILDTLHPTLDVVDANFDDLNVALAVLGPAFLAQTQAGSHGPWIDIFVRALGPDVLGVLQDTYEEVLGAAP